ncbi:MAG: hypothetical protein ACD_13C00023G0002 [uncultured bacterium]|nr:MAG: hypothetical protein ACD_13C00023G0002 [uncultured bacterium]
MKNKHLVFVALFVSVFFFASASATHALMTNPAPALFHEDDDTELFTPESLIIDFELWDIGDLLPNTFSEFGFFFAGDDPTNSANRTIIFGNEDFFSLSLEEAASINFNTGIVRDLTDFSQQDAFTPGAGDIGFYYTLNNLTIYTLSIYNILGSDVGTFRFRDNPNAYLIGFESPLVSTPLAYELVAGVSPVPEPATMMLVGTGLAGLIPVLRRKRG